MIEWFMKLSEGKCRNLFISDIKAQNVQMARYLARKLAGKTEGLGFECHVCAAACIDARTSAPAPPIQVCFACLNSDRLNLQFK